MGSFKEAEVCDLVSLFIFSKLANEFGTNNVGLYQDDGLALINNTTGRDADIARKQLHEIFWELGFRITVQVSHQIVNLYVALHLNDGKFTPYRKQSFNNYKPPYEGALKHSNYDPQLNYSDISSTKPPSSR